MFNDNFRAEFKWQAKARIVERSYRIAEFSEHYNPLSTPSKGEAARPSCSTEPGMAVATYIAIVNCVMTLPSKARDAAQTGSSGCDRHSNEAYHRVVHAEPPDDCGGPAGVADG